MFVTLGLGSVVSSAVAAVPALAVIGSHKNLVFGVSALVLALNYWLVVVRPRQCLPGDVCHVDTPLMRFNRRLFWLSAGIYAVAAIVTFGALLLVDRV